MNEETKSLQQTKMLEHFYSIIQLLPMPIYLLGLNQKYLGVNEAFLKASDTKFQSEDLVNKTPYDLFDKEQAENIVLRHKGVIKTKEIIEYEQMVKGEILDAQYYKIFVSPMYDDNQEIIGTVGTSIDITAEKRAKLFKIEEEAAKQTSRITKEWANGLINQILVMSSPVNASSNELYETVAYSSKPINTDQILTYIDKTKHTIRNISSLISLTLFNLKKILGLEHYIDQQEAPYIVAIGSCVESVLKEFVFQGNEQGIVKWDNSTITVYGKTTEQVATNDNFTCNVDALFIKQMLFSFIEDALIIIRKASHGAISINTLAGTTYNSLLFKISGSGISIKGTNILTQYYDGNTAAEVDLSFLRNRMIMQEYGGDLTYHANEGTEIVITIKFPVIKYTQP
jgi:PAS domain S-box-containing protein